MGRIVHALSSNGAVRIILVEMRDCAERTIAAHSLSGTARRLAGAGAVACGILSAHIKGEERLMLQIQSQLPRFAYTGELGADGQFRAQLSPAHVPLEAPFHLKGFFLVTKSNREKELYRGASEIDHTTLGDGLRAHLAQSTQVDGILALATRLDEAGTLVFAGGYFIERLPARADQPSLSVQAFHEKYGALAGADVEQVFTQMAFGALCGEPLDVLESREISWKCRCSLQKVEAALISLGPTTLAQILEEDGQAEVSCHFCEEAQVLNREQLEALLVVAASRQRPANS